MLVEHFLLHGLQKDENSVHDVEERAHPQQQYTCKVNLFVNLKILLKTQLKKQTCNIDAHRLNTNNGKLCTSMGRML
jgi:hypothetical protein